MKLFIIRHAETTANSAKVILGGKEQGELSQRGKRQALGLARRLGQEKITLICCSPLRRAGQTAAEIAKGRDCEVRPCPELREIEAGELAGMSHEQAEEQFPDAFNGAFADPQKKLPGGESMEDVGARAIPFVEKLISSNSSECIVLVGHNVVNRVILASLLGIPLQKARAIKMKNACIALVDAKPGFAQLYSLDNSLHGIR